jgi:hypothetical protein
LRRYKRESDSEYFEQVSVVLKPAPVFLIQYRQSAYLKPLLHSLKYPASCVNGVLLGRFAKAQDSVEIFVAEAIPLLHSHLALSPMMDAAFCLLDEYCR